MIQNTSHFWVYYFLLKKKKSIYFWNVQVMFRPFGYFFFWFFFSPIFWQYLFTFSVHTHKYRIEIIFEHYKLFLFLLVNPNSNEQKKLYTDRIHCYWRTDFRRRSSVCAVYLVPFSVSPSIPFNILLIEKGIHGCTMHSFFLIRFSLIRFCFFFFYFSFYY